MAGLRSLFDAPARDWFQLQRFSGIIGGMEHCLSQQHFAGDRASADVIIQRLVQHAGLQAEWRVLEATAAEEATLANHAAASLDCVICRLGDRLPADPARFLSGCARALHSGGVIAIACATVSGEPKIARYVNTLLKLRDPAQQWVYSLEDWDAFLFSVGFKALHVETFAREVDFDLWASSAGIRGDDLLRLRTLIVQAPPTPREALRPQQVGMWLTFTLTESVIVARRT